MDCIAAKACINGSCKNPCSFKRCGTNAECMVIQHEPSCVCKTNFAGNPLLECFPNFNETIESKVGSISPPASVITDFPQLSNVSTELTTQNDFTDKPITSPSPIQEATLHSTLSSTFSTSSTETDVTSQSFDLDSTTLKNEGNFESTLSHSSTMNPKGDNASSTIETLTTFNGIYSTLHDKEATESIGTVFSSTVTISPTLPVTQTTHGGTSTGEVSTDTNNKSYTTLSGIGSTIQEELRPAQKIPTVHPEMTVIPEIPEIDSRALVNVSFPTEPSVNSTESGSENFIPTEVQTDGPQDTLKPKTNTDVDHHSSTMPSYFEETSVGTVPYETFTKSYLDPKTTTIRSDPSTETFDESSTPRFSSDSVTPQGALSTLHETVGSDFPIAQTKNIIPETTPENKFDSSEETSSSKEIGTFEETTTSHYTGTESEETILVSSTPQLIEGNTINSIVNRKHTTLFNEARTATESELGTTTYRTTSKDTEKGSTSAISETPSTIIVDHEFSTEGRSTNYESTSHKILQTETEQTTLFNRAFTESELGTTTYRTTSKDSEKGSTLLEAAVTETPSTSIVDHESSTEGRSTNYESTSHKILQTGTEQTTLFNEAFTESELGTTTYRTTSKDTEKGSTPAISETPSTIIGDHEFSTEGRSTNYESTSHKILQTETEQTTLFNRAFTESELGTSTYRTTSKDSEKGSTLLEPAVTETPSTSIVDHESSTEGRSTNYESTSHKIFQMGTEQTTLFNEARTSTESELGTTTYRTTSKDTEKGSTPAISETPSTIIGDHEFSTEGRSTNYESTSHKILQTETEQTTLFNRAFTESELGTSTYRTTSKDSGKGSTLLEPAVTETPSPSIVDHESSTESRSTNYESTSHKIFQMGTEQTTLFKEARTLVTKSLSSNTTEQSTSFNFVTTTPYSESSFGEDVANSTKNTGSIQTTVDIMSTSSSFVDFKKTTFVDTTGAHDLTTTVSSEETLTSSSVPNFESQTPIPEKSIPSDSTETDLMPAINTTPGLQTDQITSLHDAVSVGSNEFTTYRMETTSTGKIPSGITIPLEETTNSDHPSSTIYNELPTVSEKLVTGATEKVNTLEFTTFPAKFADAIPTTESLTSFVGNKAQTINPTYSTELNQERGVTVINDPDSTRFTGKSLVTDDTTINDKSSTKSVMKATTFDVDNPTGFTEKTLTTTEKSQERMLEVTSDSDSFLSMITEKGVTSGYGASMTTFVTEKITTNNERFTIAETMLTTESNVFLSESTTKTINPTSDIGSFSDESVSTDGIPNFKGGTAITVNDISSTMPTEKALNSITNPGPSKFTERTATTDRLHTDKEMGLRTTANDFTTDTTSKAADSTFTTTPSQFTGKSLLTERALSSEGMTLTARSDAFSTETANAATIPDFMTTTKIYTQDIPTTNLFLEPNKTVTTFTEDKFSTNPIEERTTTKYDANPIETTTNTISTHVPPITEARTEKTERDRSLTETVNNLTTPEYELNHTSFTEETLSTEEVSTLKEATTLISISEIIKGTTVSEFNTNQNRFTEKTPATLNFDTSKDYSVTDTHKRTTETTEKITISTFASAHPTFTGETTSTTQASTPGKHSVTTGSDMKTTTFLETAEKTTLSDFTFNPPKSTRAKSTTDESLTSEEDLVTASNTYSVGITDELSSQSSTEHSGLPENNITVDVGSTIEEKIVTTASDNLFTEQPQIRTTVNEKSEVTFDDTTKLRFTHEFFSTVGVSSSESTIVTTAIHPFSTDSLEKSTTSDFDTAEPSSTEKIPIIDRSSTTEDHVTEVVEKLLTDPTEVPKYGFDRTRPTVQTTDQSFTHEGSIETTASNMFSVEAKERKITANIDDITTRTSIDEITTSDNPDHSRTNYDRDVTNFESKSDKTTVGIETVTDRKTTSDYISTLSSISNGNSGFFNFDNEVKKTTPRSETTKFDSYSEVTTVKETAASSNTIGPQNTYSTQSSTKFLSEAPSVTTFVDKTLHTASEDPYSMTKVVEETTASDYDAISHSVTPRSEMTNFDSHSEVTTVKETTESSNTIGPQNTYSTQSSTKFLSETPSVTTFIDKTFHTASVDPYSMTKVVEKTTASDYDAISHSVTGGTIVTDEFRSISGKVTTVGSDATFEYTSDFGRKTAFTTYGPATEKSDMTTMSHEITIDHDIKTEKIFSDMDTISTQKTSLFTDAFTPSTETESMETITTSIPSSSQSTPVKATDIPSMTSTQKTLSSSGILPPSIETESSETATSTVSTYSLSTSAIATDIPYGTSFDDTLTSISGNSVVQFSTTEDPMPDQEVTTSKQYQIFEKTTEEENHMIATKDEASHDVTFSSSEKNTPLPNSEGDVRNTSPKYATDESTLGVRTLPQEIYSKEVTDATEKTFIEMVTTSIYDFVFPSDKSGETSSTDKVSTVDRGASTTLELVPDTTTVSSDKNLFSHTEKTTLLPEFEGKITTANNIEFTSDKNTIGLGLFSPQFNTDGTTVETKTTFTSEITSSPTTAILNPDTDLNTENTENTESSSTAKTTILMTDSLPPSTRQEIVHPFEKTSPTSKTAPTAYDLITETSPTQEVSTNVPDFYQTSTESLHPKFDFHDKFSTGETIDLKKTTSVSYPEESLGLVTKRTEEKSIDRATSYATDSDFAITTSVSKEMSTSSFNEISRNDADTTLQTENILPETTTIDAKTSDHDIISTQVTQIDSSTDKVTSLISNIATTSSTSKFFKESTAEGEFSTTYISRAKLPVTTDGITIDNVDLTSSTTEENFGTKMTDENITPASDIEAASTFGTDFTKIINKTSKAAEIPETVTTSATSMKSWEEPSTESSSTFYFSDTTASTIPVFNKVSKETSTTEELEVTTLNRQTNENSSTETSFVADSSSTTERMSHETETPFHDAHENVANSTETRNIFAEWPTTSMVDASVNETSTFSSLSDMTHMTVDNNMTQFSTEPPSKDEQSTPMFLYEPISGNNENNIQTTLIEETKITESDIMSTSYISLGTSTTPKVLTENKFLTVGIPTEHGILNKGQETTENSETVPTSLPETDRSEATSSSTNFYRSTINPKITPEREGTSVTASFGERSTLFSTESEEKTTASLEMTHSTPVSSTPLFTEIPDGTVETKIFSVESTSDFDKINDGEVTKKYTYVDSVTVSDESPTSTYFPPTNGKTQGMNDLYRPNTESDATVGFSENGKTSNEFERETESGPTDSTFSLVEGKVIFDSTTTTWLSTRTRTFSEPETTSEIVDSVTQNRKSSHEEENSFNTPRNTGSDRTVTEFLAHQTTSTPISTVSLHQGTVTSPETRETKNTLPNEIIMNDKTTILTTIIPTTNKMNNFQNPQTFFPPTSQTERVLFENDIYHSTAVADEKVTVTSNLQTVSNEGTTLPFTKKTSDSSNESTTSHSTDVPSFGVTNESTESVITKVALTTEFVSISQSEFTTETLSATELATTFPPNTSFITNVSETPSSATFSPIDVDYLICDTDASCPKNNLCFNSYCINLCPSSMCHTSVNNCTLDEDNRFCICASPSKKKPPFFPCKIHPGNLFVL
ncbi:uncharacterized protein [Bemisia tabaci]|uniref:uncharacterized protein n=1 Tax=Bemisia tabaci TaxID=7038 RepID=UPI003B28524E